MPSTKRRIGGVATVAAILLAGGVAGLLLILLAIMTLIHRRNRR